MIVLDQAGADNIHKNIKRGYAMANLIDFITKESNNKALASDLFKVIFEKKYNPQQLSLWFKENGGYEVTEGECKLLLEHQDNYKHLLESSLKSNY